MLSQDMQNNPRLHPDGFESYQEWWSSVESVRVNEIRVLEEERDQARVEVSVTYQMEDGRVSNDRQQLIWRWQESGNLWVIDGTRRP